MDQTPAQQSVDKQIQQPPNRIPLFLAFLALLFLLSSLFLAYQNWQLQKQIKELSKPTPTPSPAVASAKEGTANWKTYTNEKIGFSFQYPRTLTAAGIQDNPQFMKEKTSLFGMTLHNAKGQVAFTIAVHSEQPDIKNWIEQFMNPNEFTFQKYANIGALKSYQIQFKSGTTWNIVTNNKKMYIVGTSFGNPTEGFSILSTFKFLPEN